MKSTLRHSKQLDVRIRNRFWNGGRPNPKKLFLTTWSHFASWQEMAMQVMSKGPNVVGLKIALLMNVQLRLRWQKVLKTRRPLMIMGNGISNISYYLS